MSSPLQIYPGYSDEDVSMLRAFVVQDAKIEADYFVDGFSQRTSRACVPFCASFNPERLTFPVPDDGFHAEALEYIALADAVRRAKSGFCAVEIGAGWGPWVTLAGVLARNRRITDISLIGIEALPARFKLMKEHLAANGLRPCSTQDETSWKGVHCLLRQGAATPVRTRLWFPDVDVSDMGPAASDKDVSHDYRGNPVTNIPVEGYPLSELIGSNIVDYLHIDVQGSELGLIEANLELLERQVRAMMIATHSRAIEGRLVDLLYENGWYLYREKPCRVAWSSNPTTIVAMTEVDGCQYWRRVYEGKVAGDSPAEALPKLRIGGSITPSTSWPPTERGWSPTEVGLKGSISWSDGNRSALQFECAEGVRARALAFGVWTLGEQRVRVRVNKRQETEQLLGGWLDHELVVPLGPEDLDPERVNQVEFDFPDAKVPGNGDNRRLAIALKWMEVR
jgi:hypothetical protein